MWNVEGNLYLRSYFIHKVPDVVSWVKIIIIIYFIEEKVEAIERNDFVSLADRFVPGTRIFLLKSAVFVKRLIRTPQEGSCHFSPTPV